MGGVHTRLYPLRYHGSRMIKPLFHVGVISDLAAPNRHLGKWACEQALGYIYASLLFTHRYYIYTP